MSRTGLTEKPSDSARADLPYDHGARLVLAVGLLGAGWVEAVVGDDVNAVSGQNLAVGVLLAGAGVEACVRQLQALNQQPSLHVEGVAVVTPRELKDKKTEKRTMFMSAHSCYDVHKESNPAGVRLHFSV